MKKVVLVGAGGHALSVIDSIQSKGDYEIVGITESGNHAGEKILGCEILGDDSILTSLFNSGVQHASITVGSINNTALREKLFLMLKRHGFILPAIIDKSAKISSKVLLGEGIYIGKNAIINPKATIKNMAIINTGAIIEHGCCIEEFSHIAPGAVLCGDVRIGAHTHIGANAVVIQGVNVGDNCLIGAGSVVVRNLPSGVIAYGNPCKAVINHE